METARFEIVPRIAGGPNRGNIVRVYRGKSWLPDLEFWLDKGEMRACGTGPITEQEAQRAAEMLCRYRPSRMAGR